MKKSQLQGQLYHDKTQAATDDIFNKFSSFTFNVI